MAFFSLFFWPSLVFSLPSLVVKSGSDPGQPAYEWGRRPETRTTDPARPCKTRKQAEHDQAVGQRGCVQKHKSPSTLGYACMQDPPRQTFCSSFSSRVTVSCICCPSEVGVASLPRLIRLDITLVQPCHPGFMSHLDCLEHYAARFTATTPIRKSLRPYPLGLDPGATFVVLLPALADLYSLLVLSDTALDLAHGAPVAHYI